MRMCRHELAPRLLLVAATLSLGAARTPRPERSTIAGQSFVVGIPGPVLDARSALLLREIRPAGVVLYARNFHSPEQLRSLVGALQCLSIESSGLALFVMADEEPAGATRFGLFRHVFPAGRPDWAAIHRDARVLASLGVNVDLAPLADFPFTKDAFIARRLPPIARREDLAQFNASFIAALERAGVSTTLKHFPGAGVFVDDPHHTMPHGSVEPEVLSQSLDLFHAGIRAGARLVMTAHGVYAGLDNGPVVRSRRVVTGLLREELGFDGIIMTDDLSDMKYALEDDRDAVETATAALIAGHTVVMFSHDLSETARTSRGVVAAAHRNAKLRAALQDNYERVVSFKALYADYADCR